MFISIFLLPQKGQGFNISTCIHSFAILFHLNQNSFSPIDISLVAIEYSIIVNIIIAITHIHNIVESFILLTSQSAFAPRTVRNSIPTPLLLH